MQACPSLKGFDVEQAVDRMLGQQALWWDALGFFLQHFSQWEKTWRPVIGQDAEERRVVHALRGGAANVGANGLACAATVLEDLLLLRLSGRPVAIPPAVRWYLQDCLAEVLKSGQAAYLRHTLEVAA